MAASPYEWTTETTNMCRTNRILLGPCIDQLRDVLRHRIPPGNFPHVIRRHPRNRLRLTRPQRTLILPRTGHYFGDYSDMDISLLYILLRNACNIQPHNKGWGTSPTALDTSLSASIDRIHETRNQIVHFSSFSLSWDDFIKMVLNIKFAVRSIDTYLCNGQKYDKEIDYLLSETMDPEHNRQVEESDVARLKQRLVEMNDYETQEIPLAPAQKVGCYLPIEQLFVSVIIKEEENETKKRGKFLQDGKRQERKEVKTPEDMLTKDGKPVRQVFMLGDAAHGKTAYCKWLLKKWCNAQQPGMIGRPMNEWENALSKFDFVFYLPLGNVNPLRVNVTDMICNDILGSDSVLQTVAKHILSNDRYRCLILMDGLDKWKPNQSVIDQLRYKGMPNIENMSNSVIFTTMRPNVFANVAELVRDDYRVIEIFGWDEKNFEDVIKKVLVNHHQMKPGTDEYKNKYKHIISKLEDATFRSFIHIPLLAVVCVQMCYEGEQVRDSKTSVYTDMVNMLIKRAYPEHGEGIMSRDEEINANLPKILSKKKNIKNYIRVLLKLGKLAYKGLLLNQINLDFQDEDSENKMDGTELKFALEIGLVRQKEASTIIKSKVTIHFLHKSIQEFLAAIYIATKTQLSQFCNHLTDIKVTMGLSNVIMFICGLCPSLGSVISRHVVSVTDSDKNIGFWRKLFSADTTVRELYKLEIGWYRELQYGQTVNQQADSQVAFYVADIHLNEYSDIQTMTATKDILLHHYGNIRCLYLDRVPTQKERGITNTELNDFLSKTKSLVGIYINGSDTANRSVQTICAPELKYLYLNDVSVQDSNLVDSTQSLILGDTSKLKELSLYNMNLGDIDLGLTKHMDDIDDIYLADIKMTPSSWSRFVRSLVDIDHTFWVSLIGTDIDDESIEFVRSSNHFEVNHDGDYDDDFDDDNDDDTPKDKKYALELVVHLSKIDHKNIAKK